MRCLQCSSQLALLKKFTDGEFCSAEHRQLYHEQMNQLMVERLTRTGSRLRNRHRARLAAPVSAEAPGFGDFIAMQRWEPRGWQVQLFSLGAMAAVDLDFASPTFNYRQTARRGFKTAGPIRPVIDSGAQGIEFQAIAAQPEFSARPARPRASHAMPSHLSAARLLRMRPRGPVNAGAAASARVDLDPAGLAGAPRHPQYAPAFGACKLTSADSLFGAVSGNAVDDERIPRRVAPASDVAEFSALAQLPHSQVPSRGLSLNPMDRFLRPRPRGPVADPALADSIRADSPWLPLGIGPTVPGSVVAENRFAPAQVDKFLRARPRGPVVDGALAGTLGAGQTAEPMLGAAAVPGMPGRIEFAPAEVRRLFRTIASGAIADVSLPGSLPVNARAESLMGAAAAPPLRLAAAELSPLSLDRFFRPRPRGPVADAALAGTLPSDGCAEMMPGTAMLPSLAALAGTAAPNAVERFCAPKPRGPVADVRLAGTLPAAAWPELLVGSAAVPGMSVVATPAAPLQVARMFRPRPRGPVADASLAGSLPAGTNAELMIGGAALPPLGVLAGTLAPARTDKMFRPRPRGPVADASLAGSLPAGTNTEEMVGQAALPLLGVLAGTLAPARTDKMFRPRPRGPVADATLAGSLPAGTHAEMMLGQAVLPPLTVLAGTLAPAFTDRMFRPRPRGPVATAELSGSLSLEFAEFSGTPSLPHGLMLAGPCEPKPIRKFFRPRPRGPAGPPPATTIEIAPVLPGSPESESLHGPVFGDRTIRMHFQNFSIRVREKLPVPDGMMALPGPGKAVAMAASGAGSLAIPDLAGFIAFPSLGLSPIEPKKLPNPSVRQAFTRYAPNGLAGSVSRLWSRIPSDRRWMAIAGPLLAALFMHSAFSGSSPAPKSAVRTADVTGNPIPPIQNAVSGPFAGIRQSLRDRAAVDIGDSFIDGLGSWQGEKDWFKSWSQNGTNGVQPGALALFTPSVKLQDYHLEFTGTIIKKSLSWVVRASDFRNYQAVKLQVMKPGPMPTVAVVRYAVVDGKEGPKTTTNLPFPVSSDVIYRVAMDLKDENFALTVQGKVVDFWSESQLKTGGAGFFGAKGEQARVQSVRITHQNDTLGRVFATLSPGNVEAKDGSSK